MKLDGSELLVLQACRVLHKDQYGNVHDDEIAQAAFLSPVDVRAVLESLEGYGLVTRVRLIGGQYAAQITCKGMLELSERPLPDESKRSGEAPRTIKVVPKGLRSYDKDDAGFFLTFQVVLLIHGIRTQADWGPMVLSKLEVPGQIEVIPIKYGYFDALRFWFPFWTRNKPVEKVYVQIRVALQKYRRDHPEAKSCPLSTSFQEKMY